MEERFGVDCLLLLYTKVISVLGGRLMDQKITMIPHHLMTWEQERERDMTKHGKQPMRIEKN